MKRIVILGCFLINTLMSMEQPQAPRHYNGTVIDTDTIIQLAPKAPADVQNKVQNWLYDNPRFVNIALGYEGIRGSVKKFAEFQTAANNELIAVGLKNISPCNYVFELPQTDHMIKIAGNINRKYNLMVLGNYLANPHSPFLHPNFNYYRSLTEADYKLFDLHLRYDELDKELIDGSYVVNKEAPKTYQTISRIAGYLLFLEEDRKEKFKFVSVPDMYLVHIPGRPIEVSDRNYVVVEKKMEGLKALGSVSKEEQEELNRLAKIGIFNFTGNVMRTESGTIIDWDLEQPNNSNPRHFFHKAHDRFVNNMNAGKNSLAELLK